MTRRAAANVPIEGGVSDILKTPDLSHEIQTLLAPLVPLGFPVSTYTTKDINDNRITTRLFLRTVKVLFNNPDATYRNKLLSLGITHGMWVQNRNCSSRNLFDFCNWLRTKEGEAARNDITFQLKIQRKSPNLGVAESAMVCIFKMALADMAAEVKENRVKREKQIAKISRKVAIQRAKLEKELKAVEEKYAPISEFAEPEEHVLEKECYEMYCRRWSDEVVEMAKIKYGSDVRNAMTQENSIERVKARSKKRPRYAMGPLKEIFAIQASEAKVTCCHFSSDGKLLATGGRDKKAILWLTDNQKPKATLEEHTDRITDVRFSQTNMSRLATSSFDRTVRVWDADNPGYSLRNFTGHSAAVMSLDFHPIKDDRICSCDDNGEIRYWSITNGSCLNVFEFQSGMTQVRFQPRHGKYLAASAENHITLFDVETHARVQALQGHTQKVQCLSWDSAGERLASVSEDLVRVWAVSNNKWLFINELNCSGSKFHSCVFHPFYPHLLIIGCYQNLELWDMAEKRTMTVPAHEGLVAALAVSTANGMVGSASHDKSVKLWK